MAVVAEEQDPHFPGRQAAEDRAKATEKAKDTGPNWSAQHHGEHSRKELEEDEMIPPSAAVVSRAERFLEAAGRGPFYAIESAAQIH
jgi:hypothetical protein